MKTAIDRKLKQWETALRSSFGDDISTPEMRRRAMWDFLIFDHGILRRVWTNFAQVAPGVYRSNQPDPKRYPKLADMGIKTILNLRGISPHSHYLFAVEGVRENGMTMHSFGMQARSPVPADELLRLIEAFRTLPKPFLIHCKSGADRAGMASALYLVAIEGVPPLDAMRRHLNLRFVHLKRSKTGICDHFFEVYADRLTQGPIALEDWIREEYDPDALAASFRRKRGKA